MNKRGVIYARYSCDHQREESIEGQLRECREFCKKNNITVQKEYIDRALSAKTDNRPSFLEMIKNSASKKFDYIIVWKLDRFARNRVDMTKYKLILRNNGVKILSATEKISESPEGIILESVLEGMAEYYSADLAQKVKRGMTENLLKGYFNGGYITYGYNVVNQKYEINDKESKIVQYVFDLYTKSCLTINQIKLKLNNEGYLARNGKPFPHGTLSDMLSNKKYIGIITCGNQVNEHGIPPIISKEQFEIAQERKTQRKISAGKAKAVEQYFLTDKLYCGTCGGKMVGDSCKKSSDKIYKYYVCKTNKRKLGKCTQKSIPKENLEKVVLKAIYKLLHNPKKKQHYIDSIYDYIKNKNPLIPQLEDKIETLTKKINNLVKAIEMGIDPIEVIDKMKELKDEREKIENRLNEEKNKMQTLTKKQIEYAFDHFLNLKITNQLEAKTLIELFVNKIYIYENKQIEIFLNGTIESAKITLSLDGSDRAPG